MLLPSSLAALTRLPRLSHLAHLALLTLAILARARPARADGAPKAYGFAAPPSWVTPAPLESSAAGSEGEGGVVDELFDDQIRLAPPYEHYFHRLRRITSTAGVERAGEISIELDPAYQHLAIHTLHLLRSGAVIDAARSATFRLLEQENDLDARIYNGKVTLVIVVGDLRVGDEIDLAYTIAGRNPVFGELLFTSFSLATARGAAHVRVRVLSPESNPLAVRVHGIDLPPAERTLGSERERIWDRRDLPRVIEEDDVPAWHYPVPYVSMSSARTWGDVVAWAYPLFERAAPVSPLLRARAEEIAAAAASPEDRALAALRFVQDDVRYLGMELGESTHRPHAPSTVLEQRFGDCKDKALLLVTLLHALGIEAHPALVSTEQRARIEEELPSPIAFDHAIVRIDLPGRSVWVDATRTHERGALGAVPIPYGRALVIAPGERALSTIDAPEPTEPTVDAVARFDLDGYRASFEVTTTFRQGDASSMRRRLATTSRAAVQKGYFDFYASVYKSIEPAGELEVNDDPARNVLVVRERYAIKDAMPEHALDVWATTVRAALHKPRVTRRASPLSVEHPLFVRETVQIKGARFWLPDDKTLDSAALHFSAQVHGDVGDITTLTYELRSRAGEIPPAEVAAHVRTLESIFDATSWSLPMREPPPAESWQQIPLGWWLATVGAIVVIGAGGAARAAVRRRRWKKKQKVRSGETPAAAVPVAARADAERMLSAERCPCGGGFAATGAECTWTPLRYADRAVLVGRAPCGKCGEPRVRYFALKS